jgi:hypothetical protein
MTKTLYLFLIFVFSQIASSKTPDEIIEGKKRAVLLITIYDKATGKRISNGGGFFVDNKGHFITNYHVIEDFLTKPDKMQLRFQDINGNEFEDVEILRCGNDQKIDLCYGEIKTTQKIYFFDVINKTPNKSQGIAIVGHNNTNYFSIRKGEVADIIQNSGEKFGVAVSDRDNINVPMVELTNYDYPNGKCKGDSGCPVFDFFTGDLIGVFTICYSGKQSGIVHKLAIDARSVYSFIGTDSRLNYFKIPKESIFKKSKAEAKSDEEFEKGNEFEIERKTGKLQ